MNGNQWLVAGGADMERTLLESARKDFYING
ncbi:hypothetical protein BH20VER3_BH20VER3_00240 [soil metagenome]